MEGWTHHDPLSAIGILGFIFVRPLVPSRSTRLLRLTLTVQPLVFPDNLIYVGVSIVETKLYASCVLTA